MRNKLVQLILFCAICAPAVALAAPITILSIENSNPSATGIVVSSTSYLQATWSQTVNYSDVNISAWLFGDIVNGSYLPASGTAYLTSTSLPGTLQASFTFPDAVTDVLLFSGLNLSAGTYGSPDVSNHLNLWRRMGRRLVENKGTVVTTLAPGVSLASNNFTEPADVNPANPPASVFTVENPASDGFFYSVISEVPATTPVPEPSSILLMGTASTGFILELRRRGLLKQTKPNAAAYTWGKNQ